MHDLFDLTQQYFEGKNLYDSPNLTSFVNDSRTYFSCDNSSS